MNRDHLADMVWFNPARNVMRVWLMNGTGVLEEGPDIPGPSGGGYSIPTLVDFNGDELADVIWRNPVTNRFAIWLMAGTSVLAWRGLHKACRGRAEAHLTRRRYRSRWTGSPSAMARCSRGLRAP